MDDIEILINNIKGWNVCDKYSRYLWKKSHNNPIFEEGIYFNYDIFHYFNRPANIELVTKEGIEIKYHMGGPDNTKPVFFEMKKLINEKTTDNK